MQAGHHHKLSVQFHRSFIFDINKSIVEKFEWAFYSCKNATAMKKDKQQVPTVMFMKEEQSISRKLLAWLW